MPRPTERNLSPHASATGEPMTVPTTMASAAATRFFITTPESVSDRWLGGSTIRRTRCGCHGSARPWGRTQEKGAREPIVERPRRLEAVEQPDIGANVSDGSHERRRADA